MHASFRSAFYDFGARSRTDTFTLSTYCRRFGLKSPSDIVPGGDTMLTCRVALVQRGGGSMMPAAQLQGSDGIP